MLARPTSAPKTRTAYGDMQASVNIDVSAITEAQKLPDYQPHTHEKNDMQASVSNDDFKLPDDLDDLSARCDDRVELTTQQADTSPDKKVRPFSSDTRKR